MPRWYLHRRHRWLHPSDFNRCVGKQRPTFRNRRRCWTSTLTSDETDARYEEDENVRAGRKHIFCVTIMVTKIGTTLVRKHWISSLSDKLVWYDRPSTKYPAPFYIQYSDKMLWNILYNHSIETFQECCNAVIFYSLTKNKTLWHFFEPAAQLAV